MWRHTENATKRNYDGAAKKRKKPAGRNRQNESEVKKQLFKNTPQHRYSTPDFFPPTRTILIQTAQLFLWFHGCLQAFPVFHSRQPQFSQPGPEFTGSSHVYVDTNATGKLHGKRGQFSVKAESRPAGFSNSLTSHLQSSSARRHYPFSFQDGYELNMLCLTPATCSYGDYTNADQGINEMCCEKTCKHVYSYPGQSSGCSHFVPDDTLFRFLSSARLILFLTGLRAAFWRLTAASRRGGGGYTQARMS